MIDCNEINIRLYEILASKSSGYYILCSSDTPKSIKSY